MRGWSGRTGLAAAVLLTGCAVGGGGGDVRRPSVTVADEVTAIDRGMLVGSWGCRELNPYPELPRATRTITFAGDGTVVAETLTGDDPRYGPLRGTSRGTWSVEGDRFALRDMRIEAGAAEGSPNPFGAVLGGLAGTVANTFFRDRMGGASDVLRLTRGELVFRPVAEDPPVVACTR
jgi:hypothetical protein